VTLWLLLTLFTTQVMKTLFLSIALCDLIAVIGSEDSEVVVTMLRCIDRVERKDRFGF
jgi:ABC-type histidine transport system ATPase subunit